MKFSPRSQAQILQSSSIALCSPDDTVGDLKKLISAQTGTKWDRIVLKKWYTIFKDHITLEDCCRR
ncbi:hypothetical protein pdam_00015996 [Pocillopora damicornis]|uniref:Ubiquitin-like protein 5 n=1 Tax=Pocillopora damicornis TaxID=46731 RepID=A0A3M6TT15_POCDA|nr:hypothetical protein pdam_00015996 [Pocillopora damicornis]